MSGKPPASRTCWFACQGNRQLPGLADSHVRETVSFPDLLSPQSGGRRRCFKSIRAGRNIRDQYVVVKDHEAIGLRIDAGSIASREGFIDPEEHIFVVGRLWMLSLHDAVSYLPVEVPYRAGGREAPSGRPRVSAGLLAC